MTTIDLVSSPLNEETLLKFPIESNLRKDLTKTRNICKNVLKIFQEVKNNRDLLDSSIEIINTGNDLLLEIQQIIDGSLNSIELKKEIEESAAFQRYSDCLSKFETFNHSNSNDEVCHLISELTFSLSNSLHTLCNLTHTFSLTLSVMKVRQGITKLNDELKTSTDELRETFNNWKPNRARWNGKVRKKIKSIAKMVNIKKYVSTYEKEIRLCEIKSDHVEPMNPPVVVGNITKGTYASSNVAIKVVGNFERSDPKLLELKKEIDLLMSVRECHHIFYV